VSGLDNLALQNEIQKHLDKGEYEQSVPKFRTLLAYLEGCDATKYSDYWLNKLRLAMALAGPLAKLQEAETVLRELASFFETTTSLTDLMPSALETYSQSLVNLGNVQHRLGNVAQARETFSKAKTFFVKICGVDSEEVSVVDGYIAALAGNSK
jgi:tetratricopeptide (TPR) repeat protein